MSNEPGSIHSQYAIEFSNVSKKFGALKVLDRVSFNVKKGEIFFILGRSGTGKSVLLKTLVGLVPLESGDVLIEANSIRDFKESDFVQLRTHVGLVLQHPALFDSLSVFENVAFGLRHRRGIRGSELADRVELVLKSVQLLDQARKYPAELAFGMQKRVSLARTLALEPSILLFDEPTTGLDPIVTRAVNELIQQASQEFKTTSVVVSHDMASAFELAERILFLHQGKSAAFGTRDEVFSSQHPVVQEFAEELKPHG